MNWQLKSKTMGSGLVTILWGVLILFGHAEGPPPQTIDQLGKPAPVNKQTLLGLGALGTGLTTLKGRNDVQKRLEEATNGK